MNKFVKIELLKYAKQFIINEKFEVAKSFIKQIINKTKTNSQTTIYQELLNDLEQKNFINKNKAIDQINTIIKKELSVCREVDNSIS